MGLVAEVHTCDSRCSHTNKQQPFVLFPQQNAQITTQMVPIAPISMALTGRDLTAQIDAYKDELANPKYSFRHLLFSVTDQATRLKHVGLSDIMWAEAMVKLEGVWSSDRDRLWPQLVQGFKELSNRLKTRYLEGKDYCLQSRYLEEKDYKLIFESSGSEMNLYCQYIFGWKRLQFTLQHVLFPKQIFGGKKYITTFVPKMG